MYIKLLVLLLIFGCGREYENNQDLSEQENLSNQEDISGNLQSQKNINASLSQLDIAFKADVSRGGNLCIAIFDNINEYNKDQNTDHSIKYAYLKCMSAANRSIQIFLPEKKTYAITVFHDQNKNNKLDTVGPLKIPKEGFGFSNNPSLSPGKPSWNQVKFIANKKQMNFTIQMNYLMN